MRMPHGLGPVALALLLLSPAAAAWDIDVTFIDRLPNYPYDAPKNHPDDGDPVTFVGHVKLEHTGPLTVPYLWSLDGVPLAAGDVDLVPGADNTVSAPWTWDSGRHEVMLAVNPGQAHLEASDQNNLLFDFTDGLIVGVAVEQGLVDAFPAFQEPMAIGSRSFEDWFQRMIRIWNLMFMERASNLDSSATLAVHDRVRGVLGYHPDGTLAGGNCPLQWKEVDLLWGKLASDIPMYENDTLVRFFEWSLPHELTHARYVPDTYIYDTNAACIGILDDSGVNVAGTAYMPSFSWDIVYYNKSQNEMMGGAGFRYGLFTGHLWNRVAGQRALGCNTNGCCGHPVDWRYELPSPMRLRILDLDGQPWVGAHLYLYQRIGSYSCWIDNVADWVLETDATGRAVLPENVFSGVGLFVLKIVSPDASLREYRFVERTDFHVAYWQGYTGAWDYEIRTAFALPPTADTLSGAYAARGETIEMTFTGSGHAPGQRFVYGEPNARVGPVTWIDEHQARVTMTMPSRSVMGHPYRLLNPDGQFVRVMNPYDQGVQLQFPTAEPYARFLAYPVAPPDGLQVYFNGLWSDDWGPLYHGGSHPEPGTGPIAGYLWDFGDGNGSSEPFVVHAFPAAGAYPVSLTVTDGEGLTDTVTRTVFVAVLFADDFEVGDTSLWAETLPGG